MTDNPFDDLGPLDDDDTSSSGHTQEDNARTSTDESTTVTTDESGTNDSSSPDGPAFPYDAVTQRPLYARETAWNAFEDALEIEVERTLREHGVRDAAGRELHDAALRVAAEHPEAIAAHLLELRDIDINR